MKKFLILILSMVIALPLVACGNSVEQQTKENDISSTKTNNSLIETKSEYDDILKNTTDTSDNSSDKMQTGSILVAYFAYSENMGDTGGKSADAVASASLDQSTDNKEGNLQIMAQEISKEKGADIFHILMQEPFDPNYKTMLDGAIEQIQNGILPPLQSKVENIEQYDVVFLGTPVWSNEIPPAVRTFLTENDLSGKKIIPFGIHLGSRFGNMISQIEELCPNSDILDGFTVNASKSNDEVKEEIYEWLNALEIS
ncbi:MAG: hypothetical protein NC320_12075 [Clostridium sp.]|nr:hypothetical protein [Clostridium sp.]